MNNRREDEYNINNYSDTDLYDLLDLVNPSDRVLEAKIIQMINRYTNMDNNSGKKLVTFFKQIYDRFFDGGNEEDNLSEKRSFSSGSDRFLDSLPRNSTRVETPKGSLSEVDLETNDLETNDLEKNDYNSLVEGRFMEGHRPGVKRNNDEERSSESLGKIIEGLEGMEGVPYPQVPTVPTAPTVSVDPPSAPKDSSTSIKTKQLEYSKDYLNPLLKQTVKRIISIDSQYRDNKSSLSTNFTFNLSEPLKDVVSLSLYSIQIPYTWYTINNNFGGNFFYLKGNSPGIANGGFDYKINISSGNYGPNELISSINIGLTLLKTEYTDISFGNTSIEYNSNTGLSTLNINLKNLYDETDYQLVFPTDPSLNSYPITPDPSYIISGQQLRYSLNPVSTLSSYLGFNTTTYKPNAIYSNRNIGPISNIPTETISGSYTINLSNNYFAICQYQGPGTYDPSNVVFSQAITLDIFGSGLTRTSIFNNVNKQLSNNQYLDSSNTYIFRTPITDTNAANLGFSYYELHIKWNKKTVPTANMLDLKTAIIFPYESDLSENHIWTDISNSSCFGFNNTSVTGKLPSKLAIDKGNSSDKNVICEINNVTAESTSLQTNYVINTKPYIGLICTASGYTSVYYGGGYPYIKTSNKHNDPSWNDFIIDIPNSTASGGYSLDQYLRTINTAIITTNIKSKYNSNPDGVFNITNSIIIDNVSTNNKISLKFDMNKHFKKDAYYIDLKDTVLWDLLGIGQDVSGVNQVFGMDIDLSKQYIFTGRVQSQGSYPCDSGALLLSIHPKQNYQENANADRWDVRAIYNKTDRLFPVTSVNRLYNNINSIIQTFKDLPESSPLKNTNLFIDFDPADRNYIISTLTVNIDKVLTQKNYKAVFYDPSSVIYDDSDNFLYVDISRNCWYKNLNIPQLTYDLSNAYVQGTSYSDISGSKTLSGYTYAIDKDTYFTLQPLTNGITTLDNNIKITIPAASSANNFAYTRQELYNIINEAFSNNSLTNGSYISTQYINGNQYVSIRLNINKLYTANDYRLVFYDPFSFVKCNFGISSTQNATWDSTLGWILGFRISTEYDLSKYYNSDSVTSVIVGDTTITTNLYNYFLIVLDDYTQSHLNDGLVTLTPHENQITLPSYTSKTAIQCYPNGNSLLSGSAVGNNGNNLTQNQIYAANQVLLAAKNQVKTYSNGPFIQDIFGLIPMKVSGLAVGAFYIEFGGTLQNQQRLYFGPVNIHRMTIKLITDRGDTVDLNGSNWSFSFVCEQLYQQKTI